MRVLFLLTIVAVGYLLYKLYFQQYLRQGRPGQIKIFMVSVGLLLLALAVTGRAPAIFALLGAAMTQFMRFAPLLIRIAPSLRRTLGGMGAAGTGGFGQAGQSNGQTSRVRTRSLTMTLDHASGRIDGEVLTGEFAGKHLSDLDLAELKRLYSQCEREDADALRLLQAYLSRTRAGEWQHAGDAGDSGNASSDSGKVSVAEAYDILALSPGASREEIVAAHRKLMARLHPDKGGSTYLAMKINAAKQTLLDSMSS